MTHEGSPVSRRRSSPVGGIIGRVSARGVVVGVGAALLLAAGAGLAPAQSPADTSTTTAAATSPTTTATVPATTATTTTAATTTTTTTTTTAPPPVTTAPAPPPVTTVVTTTRVASPARPKATPRRAQAATLTPHALRAGCPVAAAALLEPGKEPLLVGTAAGSGRADAQAGRLAYPAAGAIVRAGGVVLRERRCARGVPSGASARVRSLSLFGGAVVAARVELLGGATSVAGLRIEGTAVRARSGARIPIQGWGYLVVGATAPAEAALAVHLLRGHDGLPAGTVVLVPLGASRAAVPPARRRSRRRRATHRPLTVTPRLALRHYVFPVAGQVDWGDSYGGLRRDVSGNWHHGDDLFAALGTPVVAVASGTVNRVGWEQLGGWRLWVRDSGGDEFYYAHLSGYAPAVLHGDVVRAGEVIGFVGNTGDAFPTTAPHLHFEIHPRGLLHLGYDGAVDPTSYLDGWTHLAHARAPRPAHPPLPAQPALRQEARYVWRELLAARHLIRRPPSPARFPRLRLPSSAHPRPAAPPRIAAVAAAASRRGGSPSWTLVVLVALVAVGGLALVPVLSRRRAAARHP